MIEDNQYKYLIFRASYDVTNLRVYILFYRCYGYYTHIRRKCEYKYGDKYSTLYLHIFIHAPKWMAVHYQK